MNETAFLVVISIIAYSAGVLSVVSLGALAVVFRRWRS